MVAVSANSQHVGLHVGRHALDAAKDAPAEQQQNDDTNEVQLVPDLEINVVRVHCAQHALLGRRAWRDRNAGPLGRWLDVGDVDLHGLLGGGGARAQQRLLFDLQLVERTSY